MGEAWAITATNNATTAKSVTIRLPEAMKVQHLVNALTGASVPIADGALMIEVPPMFGVALIGR